MKITKSQLKQIIEAELEEAGYRQAVVDGRTGKVIRPAGPIDDEDAATGASHSAEVGIDYETGAGHSADVYDQDGNLIKKGAPLVEMQRKILMISWPECLRQEAWSHLKSPESLTKSIGNVESARG